MGFKPDQVQQSSWPQMVGVADFFTELQSELLAHRVAVGLAANWPLLQVTFIVMLQVLIETSPDALGPRLVTSTGGNESIAAEVVMPLAMNLTKTRHDFVLAVISTVYV